MRVGHAAMHAAMHAVRCAGGCAFGCSSHKVPTGACLLPVLLVSVFAHLPVALAVSASAVCNTESQVHVISLCVNPQYRCSPWVCLVPASRCHLEAGKRGQFTQVVSIVALCGDCCSNWLVCCCWAAPVFHVMSSAVQLRALRLMRLSARVSGSCNSVQGVQLLPFSSCIGKEHAECTRTADQSVVPLCPTFALGR
jgi:hypothetical protein